MEKDITPILTTYTLDREKLAYIEEMVYFDHEKGIWECKPVDPTLTLSEYKKAISNLAYNLFDDCDFFDIRVSKKNSNKICVIKFEDGTYFHTDVKVLVERLKKINKNSNRVLTIMFLAIAIYGVVVIGTIIKDIKTRYIENKQDVPESIDTRLILNDYNKRQLEENLITIKTDGSNEITFSR